MRCQAVSLGPSRNRSSKLKLVSDIRVPQNHSIIRRAIAANLSGSQAELGNQLSVFLFPDSFSGMLSSHATLSEHWEKPKSVFTILGRHNVQIVKLLRYW